MIANFRYSGKEILVIGACVCFTVLFPGVLTYAYGQVSQSAFYPAGSQPYGQSYDQWVAKQSQWSLSAPASVNPVNDTSGVYCGQNQNDTNVWFLAGTFGGQATRNCTIPYGKAILFPVLNGECTYADSPGMKSPQDLLKCAEDTDGGLGNSGHTLKADFDGITITNLESFRVQSPLFNLTLPKDNILSVAPGNTQGIVDGWYVMLQPPSAGQHKLHFSGTLLANPALSVTAFATDVTYNLDVKPSVPEFPVSSILLVSTIPIVVLIVISRLGAKSKTTGSTESKL